MGRVIDWLRLAPFVLALYVLRFGLPIRRRDETSRRDDTVGGDGVRRSRFGRPVRRRE